MGKPGKNKASPKKKEKSTFNVPEIGNGGTIAKDNTTQQDETSKDTIENLEKTWSVFSSSLDRKLAELDIVIKKLEAQIEEQKWAQRVVELTIVQEEASGSEKQFQQQVDELKKKLEESEVTFKTFKEKAPEEKNKREIEFNESLPHIKQKNVELTKSLEKRKEELSRNIPKLEAEQQTLSKLPQKQEEYEKTFKDSIAQFKHALKHKKELEYLDTIFQPSFVLKEKIVDGIAGIYSLEKQKRKISMFKSEETVIERFIFNKDKIENCVLSNCYNQTTGFDQEQFKENLRTNPEALKFFINAYNPKWQENNSKSESEEIFKKHAQIIDNLNNGKSVQKPLANLQKELAKEVATKTYGRHVEIVLMTKVDQEIKDLILRIYQAKMEYNEELNNKDKLMRITDELLAAQNELKEIEKPSPINLNEVIDFAHEQHKHEKSGFYTVVGEELGLLDEAVQSAKKNLEKAVGVFETARETSTQAQSKLLVAQETLKKAQQTCKQANEEYLKKINEAEYEFLKDEKDIPLLIEKQKSAMKQFQDWLKSASENLFRFSNSLTRLEEKLKIINDKKEKLKEDQQGIANIRTELTKTIKNSQDKQKKLAASIGEIRVNIIQQNGELESLLKKMNSEDKQNLAELQQLVNTKTELENLNVELQNLKTLKDKQTSIVALNQEIANAKAKQYDSIDPQYCPKAQEINKDIVSLNKFIDDFNTEKKTLEAAEKKAKELNQELTKLETEYKTLLDEKESEKKTIDEIKDKLQEISKELKAHQGIHPQSQTFIQIQTITQQWQESLAVLTAQYEKLTQIKTDAVPTKVEQEISQQEEIYVKLDSENEINVENKLDSRKGVLGQIAEQKKQLGDEISLEAITLQIERINTCKEEIKELLGKFNTLIGKQEFPHAPPQSINDQYHAEIEIFKSFTNPKLRQLFGGNDRDQNALTFLARIDNDVDAKLDEKSLPALQEVQSLLEKINKKLTQIKNKTFQFYDPNQLIVELTNYIKRRNGKDDYFTFWGRLTGMDREAKTDAAQKVINRLNKLPDKFSEKDYYALSEGELGRIISKYKCLPEELASRQAADRVHTKVSR